MLGPVGPDDRFRRPDAERDGGGAGPECIARDGVTGTDQRVGDRKARYGFDGVGTGSPRH